MENGSKKPVIENLENEWTLWFDLHPPQGITEDNFNKHVIKIGEFSTIKKFWNYFHNIDIILKKGPMVSNIRIFKSNIKPIWEDNTNINGGFLIFPLPRSFSEAKGMWIDLCLAAISEAFEETSYINGIVLARRNTRYIIRIWLSETNLDIRSIFRFQVQGILSLPENFEMKYKTHLPTQASKPKKNKKIDDKSEPRRRLSIDSSASNFSAYSDDSTLVSKDIKNMSATERLIMADSFQEIDWSLINKQASEYEKIRRRGSWPNVYPKEKKRTTNINEEENLIIQPSEKRWEDNYQSVLSPTSSSTHQRSHSIDLTMDLPLIEASLLSTSLKSAIDSFEAKSDDSRSRKKQTKTLKKITKQSILSNSHTISPTTGYNRVRMTLDDAHRVLSSYADYYIINLLEELSPQLKRILITEGCPKCLQSKTIDSSFVVLKCRLLDCEHVLHASCFSSHNDSNNSSPSLHRYHCTSTFHTILLPEEHDIIPSDPPGNLRSCRIELQVSHILSNAQLIGIDWPSSLSSLIDIRSGRDYLMILLDPKEYNVSFKLKRARVIFKCTDQTTDKSWQHDSNYDITRMDSNSMKLILVDSVSRNSLLIGIRKREDDPNLYYLAYIRYEFNSTSLNITEEQQKQNAAVPESSETSSIVIDNAAQKVHDIDMYMEQQDQAGTRNNQMLYPNATPISPMLIPYSQQQYMAPVDLPRSGQGMPVFSPSHREQTQDFFPDDPSQVNINRNTHLSQIQHQDNWRFEEQQTNNTPSTAAKKHSRMIDQQDVNRFAHDEQIRPMQIPQSLLPPTAGSGVNFYNMMMRDMNMRSRMQHGMLPREDGQQYPVRWQGGSIPPEYVSNYMIDNSYFISPEHQQMLSVLPGMGQGIPVLPPAFEPNYEELLFGENFKHQPGHVFYIAKTQGGSRLIQDKLDSDPQNVFPMLFNEMKDYTGELMTDCFGHYAIEKLMRVANDDQKTHLLMNLCIDIGSVATHKQGTFSIQAIMDTIHSPTHITLLGQALKLHVLRLILNASGHFVILRFLQKFNLPYSQFIHECVCKNCLKLASDHYGLRVIKTMLTLGPQQELHNIYKAIARQSMKLAENQYGNYCIQNVLETGPESIINSILMKMEEKFVRMARQKYSSNVVEKCLTKSTGEWRTRIISELIGSAADLVKDRYGNYVLQTAVALANREQIESVIKIVSNNLHLLRDNVRQKWERILQSALERNEKDNQNQNHIPLESTGTPTHPLLSSSHYQSPLALLSPLNSNTAFPSSLHSSSTISRVKSPQLPFVPLNYTLPNRRSSPLFLPFSPTSLSLVQQSDEEQQQFTIVDQDLPVDLTGVTGDPQKNPIKKPIKRRESDPSLLIAPIPTPTKLDLPPSVINNKNTNTNTREQEEKINTNTTP